MPWVAGDEGVPFGTIAVGDVLNDLSDQYCVRVLSDGGHDEAALLLVLRDVHIPA